jgi:hypothetical protein
VHCICTASVRTAQLFAVVERQNKIERRTEKEQHETLISKTIKRKTEKKISLKKQKLRFSSRMRFPGRYELTKPYR